jgi:hypothetical protein
MQIRSYIRKTATAFAVGALGLALVPAVGSANSQITAYGPLAASTDYVETINVINYDAWFVFYVRDSSDVTVTVTPGGPNPVWAAEVTGPNGLTSGSSDSWLGHSWGPWALNRGAYYIEVHNEQGNVSRAVGQQYAVRVTTDGVLTNRNEIEALNNRDADTAEVSLYSGQVQTGTRSVHNAQADVRRQTTILHRAHGRNAINRARHNLNVAKQTLASRQRVLKAAQANLAVWQARLNSANLAVAQYA